MFWDLPLMRPLRRDEPYPSPNRFSIETSSWCNRRCSFCPHSLGKRGQHLMDWDIYVKIVESIRGFKDNLSMFLLNEPLLNPRLEQEMRLLREACPRATIRIATNGDTLKTVDDVLRVFSWGINVICFNVYDANSRLWALAKKGPWEITEHKYHKHRPSGMFVSVTDMQHLKSGGGRGVDRYYERVAPNELAPQIHCCRPMKHMTILYDGRVPLCCALDPTSEDLVVAGDLHTQSIDEIWNSEVFWRYRKALQDKRRVLPGCKTCTQRVAYAHVVRRVC